MTLTECVADLKEEFLLTEKVLSAFTDEGLAQQVVPGGKSAAELAWHIVQAIPMISAQVAVAVDQSGVKVPAPKNVSEVLTRYRQVTSGLLTFITENWSEERLSESHSVYGKEWTKGKTLQVILRHEIHHRGQLMTLLRQAGLKVPAVYGPSGDEK